MELNTEKIQNHLCQALCADIKIVKRHDSHYLIETPFSFPDGDSYQIYLEQLSMDKFRLKDGGHTLMHLSYEHDVDSFWSGNRNIILKNIQNEFDVREENGDFFIECTANDLAKNIFRFGQALTKICDLTFLDRSRVQNPQNPQDAQDIQNAQNAQNA